METSDLLFVYGTLRTGAQALNAPILTEFGHSLGPAMIRGTLYQVSPSYPGLCESPNGGFVQGELWRLTNASASLELLDEYERSAGGDRNADAEYQRCLRPVVLASSDQVHEAWVYLYIRPVREDQLIASGDFLSPTRPPARQ